jgi:hypothetical protein
VKDSSNAEALSPSKGFIFSRSGDLIFPVEGFDFSSRKARENGLFAFLPLCPLRASDPGRYRRW